MDINNRYLNAKEDSEFLNVSGRDGHAGATESDSVFCFVYTLRIDIVISKMTYDSLMIDKSI